MTVKRRKNELRRNYAKPSPHSANRTAGNTALTNLGDGGGGGGTSKCTPRNTQIVSSSAYMHACGILYVSQINGLTALSLTQKPQIDSFAHIAHNDVTPSKIPPGSVVNILSSSILLE